VINAAAKAFSNDLLTLEGRRLELLIFDYDDPRDFHGEDDESGDFHCEPN
jgi:hypothetical protein